MSILVRFIYSFCQMINMYIERGLKKKFDMLRGISNIIAVVGARQAGKTTFLREQARGVKSSYMLFDDPEVRGVFEEDIKKFERLYVEGQNISILDEVQYCKDAGSKLKYLADMGHKIWMTSSSEIILAKDVLSYLVGRVSILRMYPFSLAEFLASNPLGTATKTAARRSLWEHMLYGGYPRVVVADGTEAKKAILANLYETMIMKDVAMAFSVEDMKSLEAFAAYLSFSVGDLISYGNISNSLDVSFRTIKKYFDAMERSYIIKRVEPLFANKTKEITKQPKVYFIDSGMRNAIARSFPAEPDGKLFENYVFSELTKLGFSPKYWRTKTGAEVDFIIEKGREVIPIEAKLKAEQGKVERSLRSFIEIYKPKRAFLVNYRGSAGKMKVNGCDVIFTDVFGMEKLISPA